jgi:HK97 gp10 family phage protein
VLNNVDKLLKEAELQALHALGKFYVKEMRKRTPVDKGNLKQKCNYKVENDKLYLLNEAEYAGYVEYGTYKMQAQPFMKPAIFDTITQANKIVKEVFDAKLK